MRLSTISTAFSSLIGLSLASPMFCDSRVVDNWELEEIFHKYTTQFYITKNMTAAFQYVRADYIQHNPFVGQGAQTALTLLSKVWPSLDIEIKHISLQNDIGWIHYRAQGPFYPIETAIVDIVRFNGSCVQEHWDVIESLPANATNPLALF